MALARIGLSSGRPVELTSLVISSTYAGFVQGYPSARINQALIARLGRRREFGGGQVPAHVVTPSRSRPRDHGRAPMPFGPVETLPPVYCEGSFRSEPVAPHLDPVLHESRLVVVWFEEDLARPVADFTAAAMRELAWDELAEDIER